MSHSTPETERHFKEAMGDELGLLFSYLWGEHVRLHQKWNEYRELFATDEKRVQILEETAPGFFSLVQDMLWAACLCIFAGSAIEWVVTTKPMQ